MACEGQLTNVDLFLYVFKSLAISINRVNVVV